MNITEKYIKEAMSVQEADEILADFEQKLKSQKMSEGVEEKE